MTDRAECKRARYQRSFKAKDGSSEMTRLVEIRSRVDVAKIMGISRERVRQIEEQAMKKIRRRLYAEARDWGVSL